MSFERHSYQFHFALDSIELRVTGEVIMNLWQKSIIGGLFLSLFHFLWILLVAAGWAQPVMDFVFKLHMLNSPFTVQPFDIQLAIGLLAITFLAGCFYVLAFLLIKNLIAD